MPGVTVFQSSLAARGDRRCTMSASRNLRTSKIGRALAGRSDAKVREIDPLLPGCPAGEVCAWPEVDGLSDLAGPGDVAGEPPGVCRDICEYAVTNGAFVIAAARNTARIRVLSGRLRSIIEPRMSCLASGFPGNGRGRIWRKPHHPFSSTTKAGAIQDKHTST